MKESGFFSSCLCLRKWILLFLFIQIHTHTCARLECVYLALQHYLMSKVNTMDPSHNLRSTSFYSLKLKNQTLWNEPGSLCWQRKLWTDIDLDWQLRPDLWPDVSNLLRCIHELVQRIHLAGNPVAAVLQRIPPNRYHCRVTIVCKLYSFTAL